MMQMGQQLSIVVEYEAPFVMRSPKLGFVMFAEEGIPVINANNQYQKDRVEATASDSGGSVCDLGMVLMPGLYHTQRLVWRPGNRFPRRSAGSHAKCDGARHLGTGRALQGRR